MMEPGRPLRIALFHNLPSGGAKRHTYEQVKELARRGHRITEYAPSTADLHYCAFAPFVDSQCIYQAPQLRLFDKRIPFVTPYLHALQIIIHLQQTAHVNKVIAKDIDEGGYDLALAKDCSIISNPYVLRYLATKTLFQCHHGGRPAFERRATNRSTSKTFLCQLRSAYYSPLHALVNGYLNRSERRNIRCATTILTNSAYSEGLLFDLYGVRATAIYPGVDTQVFHPKNMPKGNYVLSVGALIYSKGHRFLLSALALIDPEIRPGLFIAANSRAPDEERIVKAMAGELGVDLKIETVLDSERLVSIYNEARAFVYAPMREALGLAPLEAMACGTPVVAVGEAGVKETVLNGVTGWLVDRDPACFAEKLGLLLANTNLQRQFGDAGIGYVRQQWTWQRAVDNLEDQFSRVLAENSVNKLDTTSVIR
ncbi:MAG: glycosyltransferase family 4 protein [Anaerolineae bacterium]|nr:glycosyltransferase family 4 protein [Anaerolineae bacterium]